MFFQLEKFLAQPRVCEKRLMIENRTPLAGFGVDVGSRKGFAIEPVAGFAGRAEESAEARLTGRFVLPVGMPLVLISHLRGTDFYTSTCYILSAVRQARLFNIAHINN